MAWLWHNAAPALPDLTDRHLEMQPVLVPDDPGPPYYEATKHPLCGLLMVLPLLIVYEGGVAWFGGERPEMMRNGADVWMHAALTACGLPHGIWVPAILLGVLIGWTWVQRDQRPRRLADVAAGMILESVGAALVLWCLSRCLGMTLDQLDLEIGKGFDGVTVQVISFVGAGVYEEVLFRLVLFGSLLGALRLALLPRPLAIGLAAAGSALAFAGAHHFGPCAEPFDPRAFLFRGLAGIYFTALVLARGLGIAVGAHVCYDVLVGLATN
jgi:membrane protease YdiL (CAAX protease family)